MKNSPDYRIPLNDYFKAMGLTGDKRRSSRKVMKAFNSIVRDGNKQYLSLTKYTSGRMEHLARVGKNALTSNDFHVLEFYSDMTRDLLFEWFVLTKIFVDSLPDSKSTTSVDKLQKVFDQILEQHVSISKHHASANRLLFKLVYLTPRESGSPRNTKADK